MSPFFIVAGSLLLLGIIVWLVLRWLIRSGARMIAEESECVTNSPRATAQVLEIGKSQTQRQRSNILVKLRLEVYPDSNFPAFQTTTVWEVEPAALQQIQPNSRLSVKYDANEKRRIYPLDSWASYNDFLCRLWLGNKSDD